MAELKGKVVLIFNSASACGFTPQLQGLQSLHKELGEKGLAVIGFPTDDFKQETGTEDEIAEFCQANVNFMIKSIVWSFLSNDGKDTCEWI